MQPDGLRSGLATRYLLDRKSAAVWGLLSSPCFGGGVGNDCRLTGDKRFVLAFDGGVGERVGEGVEFDSLGCVLKK